MHGNETSAHGNERTVAWQWKNQSTMSTIYVKIRTTIIFKLIGRLWQNNIMHHTDIWNLKKNRLVHVYFQAHSPPIVKLSRGHQASCWVPPSTCHDYDVVGKSKMSDVFAVDVDAKSLSFQELEGVFHCGSKQFQGDNILLTPLLNGIAFVLCSCTRTDMVALSYKHFNTLMYR